MRPKITYVDYPYRVGDRVVIIGEAADGLHPERPPATIKPAYSPTSFTGRRGTIMAVEWVDLARTRRTPIIRVILDFNGWVGAFAHDEVRHFDPIERLAELA